MTTINELLAPPPEPYLIYPSERITCDHFTSATPELVHHSAILRAVDPLVLERPCGTCGQDLSDEQPAYHCSICRRPVCASCAHKDGYTLEPHHLDPAEADQPPMLVWDLDRRDFLIREIKEQAWNAQEGRCGQCHESMADISRTSIINVPNGPMLLCDRPCAARAMGRDELLPPGNYPTDPIRIVADPRHGIPQDWLNVHFEMSLPEQSDEVWSKADCQFGVELYADPERWDFFCECVECRMESYGNGRPHKWCSSDFFLRDKSVPPGTQYSTYNAQMILGALGDKPEKIDGVYVRSGDPDCLDYWRIDLPQRPKRRRR